MAYLTRGFTFTLIAVFLFLIVFLLFSANQAYLTATPETANQTLQEIEAQRQAVTFQSILINNLMVSGSLIIPAIGTLPFLIAWYSTGQVIGLLSYAYNVPPANYVSNLVVLAFPEIAAYSILLAENVYVTFLALTRTGAKQRILQHSWKSLILYILLLTIGAITEAMMIA